MIKERGCVKIRILFYFVIQSVAKDLGNTHLMYSRFFGRVLNNSSSLRSE